MDYTKEQPTLVTFILKDAPGNATLLTVVESGFDKVPPQRRLEALRMNTRGWQGRWITSSATSVRSGKTKGASRPGTGLSAIARSSEAQSARN